MVTSKDVAESAGVSRATVSAVINNKKSVSFETRKKILKIIKKLNYRPDSIARSLKMKSTRTFGVIIPNISNPIFSYAIKGLENYANSKKYNIILCASDENYKKEKEAIEILLSKKVDGIIMIPCSTKNIKYIKENVLSTTLPFIILDRKIEGLSCDMVIGNNKMGSYLATKYFIDNGYKNIVLLTHQSKLSIGINRIIGYKNALKDNNIKINEDFIIQINEINSITRSKLADLLNEFENLGVIAAMNHLALIKVLIILRELNNQFSDKVKIISFDYLPWCQFIKDVTGFISLDMYGMGIESSKILVNKTLSRIKEKRFKLIVFDPELVIL